MRRLYKSLINKMKYYSKYITKLRKGEHIKICSSPISQLYTTSETSTQKEKYPLCVESVLKDLRREIQQTMIHAQSLH